MKFHRASLAALLAPALSAQLPEWTTLPFANTTRLFVEASIVVAQEPAKINAYSSYTRSWSSLPVSATATFTGHDDHAIVQDSVTFWGYATRFSRFTPLVTSSGSLYPTAAQAWASVVTDGNTAYVYSAFTGAWLTIPFAAPVTALASRLAVVLTDGNKVVAVSAHFGTAVTAPATSWSATIGAIGLCGYAVDGAVVHAFSAYQNSWATIPVSTGATVVKPPSRASYLAITDGARVTFYSGVTGTTASLTATSAPTLALQDDVAVVTDPVLPFVHAYSGLAGKLVMKTVSATPTVTVKRYFALIQHGTTTEAFSGTLGAFAPELVGDHTFQSDICVALARKGSTPVAAYSPLTNAWSPAPAVASPVTFLTWCSAILVDPAGGLDGFSSNTGSWAHAEAAPTDGNYATNAMFCARAGTKLWAFEPRKVHWTSVDTGIAVTSVTCFDQSILARVGDTAWCYCLFSDHWSSVTTAGPMLGTQVRDECSVAWDATTLHVFGASDQVSNVANFPFYWRVLAHGGPVTYHIAGQSGDSSLLLINARPASIPIPGLGTLLVDPTAALALSFPPLPPEGIVRFTTVLPDDPALVGVTLHVQAAILHGALAYLTGANSMRIF